MPNRIRGTGKRRGRPKGTGPGIQIGTRWQQPLLSKIDNWAKQYGVGSRAEAIRRLVEKGLGLATFPHPTSDASQQPAEPPMTRERAAFLKAALKGL